MSTASENTNFIIVSSGAISQGMNILNIESKPKDLQSLQALAAIGQQQLMGLYEKAFGDAKKLIAQVLLTHDDMNDHDKYKNAKATIDKLLNLNVIPIINENDVVATEEIRFGDNDKLAAMVANLINADLLVILTNQDGFFDKNPDNYDDAKLIKNCNIYDIDIKVGILLSELILFYRLFFNNDLNLIGAIAIYITYEFSFLLIYRCNLYSKERYYTVGVEGMSILMGVLFFFSQRFFG